ncbi:hypothetical protein EO244_12645 [Ancylomarina salipaludis]|uniref:Uncharacterized protein n=1 Tax=Ancylomarina salipaludis TaxID=2501299 RepID=A0A4Q1JKD5_9BACT|nr:hypothetical protein [Ancylomarina salipaludis]RXQ90947.1 hypothetical protein EO244_12645 [Ancylomarina salipaludis]
MTEIFEIIKVQKKKKETITQRIEDSKLLGFWEKDNNQITEVHIEEKTIQLLDEEDICTALTRDGYYNSLLNNTDFELNAIKTSQKRGRYYPRIFTPVYSLQDTFPKSSFDKIQFTNGIKNDNTQIINTLEQLRTLIDLVDKVFRTVYPCENNFSVYGFDIRNLIILACTEFEAQISGILKANNIKPTKGFYNTGDFIKLKGILKLDQYKVAFKYYPELTGISPFSGWDSNCPTKSLEWYYNYNSIKHDRDNEFSKSRLQDLINSISACFIIIIAQYGELSIIKEILNGYWSIVQYPEWQPEERLLEPSIQDEWKKENYYA